MQAYISRILIAAAILLSSLFLGCEKDLPTYYEFDPYTFSSQDPEAGSWKPLLLSRPDQIAVPPPPEGDAYAAELAQARQATASLSAEAQAAVAYWSNNPLVRWNEIARELVSKYNLIPAPNADGSYGSPSAANPADYPFFPFSNPVYSCRAYAYWSAAQFDALIAVWHYKYVYNRPAPTTADDRIVAAWPSSGLPSYPADGATVAAVSEAILGAMFPLEKDFLAAKAAEHRQAMRWSGTQLESDLTAGEALGKAVAALFLGRAASDGTRNAGGNAGTTDSLRNAAQARWGWAWENLEQPQRPSGLAPLFGQVQLWCVPSVEIVRPPVPPAPGTPAFERDAEELRQIADNLSREQRRIANFWSDGLGTYTPPGHWNRLASEFVVQYQLNPVRTARTFAYLNMAMMDAGISCWDAKYYYYYPRPSQLMPGFKTILGIPNFPGYTSGHSTFSAAAATVLGHIFPAEANRCDAWAEEAALSRLYGGIHFRFDAEAGLEQGRRVASYSVAVARADGAE